MDNQFYEFKIDGTKVTIPKRYENLTPLRPGSQGVVVCVFIILYIFTSISLDVQKIELQVNMLQ